MEKYNNTVQSKNFGQFLISYISLSVIAGLFSYRLINSLLDLLFSVTFFAYA